MRGELEFLVGVGERAGAGGGGDFFSERDGVGPGEDAGTVELGDACGVIVNGGGIIGSGGEGESAGGGLGVLVGEAEAEGKNGRRGDGEEAGSDSFR